MPGGRAKAVIVLTVSSLVLLKAHKGKVKSESIINWCCNINAEVAFPNLMLEFHLPFSSLQKAEMMERMESGLRYESLDGLSLDD